MRAFLVFVVLSAAFFVLPPLPALLVFFGIGLPLATWWVMRDFYPRSTDPDLMAGDRAETERLRQDKVGRLTAIIQRIQR